MLKIATTLLAAAIMAGMSCSPSRADDSPTYPQRPVTLVVQGAPGETAVSIHVQVRRIALFDGAPESSDLRIRLVADLSLEKRVLADVASGNL